MADSRDNRGKPTPSSWPIQQADASAPARKDSAAAAPKPGESEHRAGRIVHDDRGNAVWNWVKGTGRFCIDSTSALLKRLDFGGLEVEGDKEEGVRKDDPGRDAGGGYDPYNQKIVPKPKPTPPKK
jgi:hypothetical protein